VIDPSSQTGERASFGLQDLPCVNEKEYRPQLPHRLGSDNQTTHNEIIYTEEGNINFLKTVSE
jgi:hypothetical protein